MASDLEGLSTDELVAAATEADQHEFGDIVATLMLRFKRLTYAQALQLCGNDPSLADDVFQDTFLRLFQFLRNRRGRAPIHSFAGLVRVIARRAAIDVMRRERRHEGAPLEAADQAASQDRDFDAGRQPGGVEAALYARQLMDGLAGLERRVVEFLFIGGLTPREVAATLKIEANYVRQLKFRALERIRLRIALDRTAQLVEPL
jgi:RNA polymerase sigma factor (sigma-70 family)